MLSTRSSNRNDSLLRGGAVSSSRVSTSSSTDFITRTEVEYPTLHPWNLLLVPKPAGLRQTPPQPCPPPDLSNPSTRSRWNRWSHNNSTSTPSLTGGPLIRRSDHGTAPTQTTRDTTWSELTLASLPRSAPANPWTRTLASPWTPDQGGVRANTGGRRTCCTRIREPTLLSHPSISHVSPGHMTTSPTPGLPPRTTIRETVVRRRGVARTRARAGSPVTPTSGFWTIIPLCWSQHCNLQCRRVLVWFRVFCYE